MVPDLTVLRNFPAQYKMKYMHCKQWCVYLSVLSPRDGISLCNYGCFIPPSSNSILYTLPYTPADMFSPWPILFNSIILLCYYSQYNNSVSTESLTLLLTTLCLWSTCEIINGWYVKEIPVFTKNIQICIYIYIFWSCFLYTHLKIALKIAPFYWKEVTK